MYEGRLRFAGPDSFSIRWSVTGPRKEGVISNKYTRLPGRKLEAAVLS